MLREVKYYLIDSTMMLSKVIYYLRDSNALLSDVKFDLGDSNMMGGSSRASLTSVSVRYPNLRQLLKFFTIGCIMKFLPPRLESQAA